MRVSVLIESIATARNIVRCALVRSCVGCGFLSVAACLALSASAASSEASPFRDVPAPIAGPSKLASLAFSEEFDSEPSYKNYHKATLGRIRAAYVLGENTRLTVEQLSDLYRLIVKATAVGGPQSLCIIKPRHYLTYTSEFGTVEVLLCFECGEAIFNINGWSTNRHLDKSYQTQLNNLLRQHGIPVPVSK